MMSGKSSSGKMWTARPHIETREDVRCTFSVVVVSNQGERHLIEATIDVHAGALDQPQRSLVLKLATLGCCLLRADLRPVDSDLLLELRRSYLTLRTLTCCMSHSGSYLQSQHILTFW